MFGFLAKSEGRKGELTRYECLGSRLDPETKGLAVSPWDKVEMIAQHFAKKLKKQKMTICVNGLKHWPGPKARFFSTETRKRGA